MNVNSEDGEENRCGSSRTEECQSILNIKQSRRKPTRQLCQCMEYEIINEPAIHVRYVLKYFQCLQLLSTC